MTSRIFLILVGGTVISGALVIMLAQHERNALTNQIRARHAAERVQQVILTLEAIPATSRQALAAITEKSGIRIDFSNDSTSIGQDKPTEFSDALAHIYGSDKTMVNYERWDADCPVRHSDRVPANEIKHCQTVLTTLKDGTPIRVDIGMRDNVMPLLSGYFLLNIFIFLMVIFLLSFIVAHIVTKHLRMLAHAAQSFGNNIEHPPLSVKNGTKEVREAAVAFNTMQTSIRNHIQERTYMLAAIAHDLQTPLTRLRLRLEKVADTDLRKSLVGDLTTTQDMIREGLEYAQLMNAEDPVELVDIDSLIAAICNDAIDTGSEVSFEGKIGKPILASSNALRRCISNLLDNAIKYGGFAHVRIKREDDKAVITILDAGPGIPDDQLETVFQPFKRLEDSRSRSSGGTGLGLTIARIIAGRHRGSIKLSNIGKEDSGLMATLELPVT
jgi:signal transduction histidine kinase